MNILSSPLTLKMGIEVHMTSAESLRSRVKRNFQARFCRRVRGSDSPFDSSGIGGKFTLYTAHLILPFPAVRDRMDARRLMRLLRRGRRINRKMAFSKRAHRQKRLANRRQGKLAPSNSANRQLELRIVSFLCQLYPVAEIRYEYVRADVDLTSGRRAAKSGKGFSGVMVGQVWMPKQLGQIASTIKIEDHQTASTRKHLGLVNNKADKSLAQFNTHAVDGVSIAASHFVQYRQDRKQGEDGANWFASVSITPALFFVIRRPPYSRRQLHLMVPAKGGNRRKYGRHGLRKGDLVDSPKGIGYAAWRYRKTNICQRCQLEAVGADCGIEGVVNSQKYWVGCLGGTLATLNNR
ncbi:hypothetical protein MiSe_12310 [Microseira wollei NIES-4236]|uniref:RRXRR domain-containing protein n=1 Tax=Microseira wollei NIES-4236 TaxID=2530354 RepID=A0AAV3X764_9CYAN|nr:RRXRR domain-containing protein [Microseira wollei]GET36480.1 hypothetical protein MiSe_12310 [Microseira wollei NIES-4236]